MSMPGAILLVLLLVAGLLGVIYSMVVSSADDPKLVPIGLISLLIVMGTMFWAGSVVGKPHDVYQWGCKQTPEIAVNNITYRCTP